ncbi:MAG: T9SS type A sorting domain-containing protein [candidate division KSB1 bacterium]|nr:T9SS type A sorting domain-containing protein [candidate division KSB1 bacterium]
MNAGIDIVNHKAFWIFRSIDPSTGELPADPLLGLLPVNDAARRGEGFVQFQVRADAGAQTGDRVQARARIVFDTNDPIDTPEIFHTLDADLPTSRLDAVPAQVEQRDVELQWQASDAGAGLKQFALYISTDDGPFQLLENGIEGQAYRFSGEPGHVYRLFVLAEDWTGNAEAAKTAAEITFQIVVTSVADRALPKVFRLYANYPNPFNPRTAIQFDVPRETRVEIRIFNVLGQEVRLLADKPFAPGTHTLQWDGRSGSGRAVGSGVYFILMKTDGFTAVRKMTLLR